MGKAKLDKKLRWLANTWMALTIIFIIFNFLSNNKYGFILSPLTLLYISLLSVYVTSKEFDRWYRNYNGRHPGEIAIVLWTFLIAGMLILNFCLGKDYHIPSEVVSTYAAVVGIFIISKKSKNIHLRRSNRK